MYKRQYYDRLVDEAVETISQYGDFEQFISDVYKRQVRDPSRSASIFRGAEREALFEEG